MVFIAYPVGDILFISPLFSLERMELRSRSRSKTPFLTENFLQSETSNVSNNVSVTRSTRRTTIRYYILTFKSCLILVILGRRQTTPMNLMNSNLNQRRTKVQN